MEHVLPGLHGAPNIHPFFVHFPIVLWLTALGFWVVGAVAHRPGAWRAGTVLLYLAVLSAIPTVVTGLAAEDQYHHLANVPMDRIHLHKYFMIATTGGSVLVAALAYATRKVDRAGRRWALIGLLAAVNLTGSLGADRGAELVLHHGLGTRIHDGVASPGAESHQHR